MNTNKDIQDKIDETLNSIDAFDTIHVSPFFKDKMMQRLFVEKDEKVKSIWTWFAPQYQLVILMIMVVLNVFAITQLDPNTSNDEIDEFAQTYHLSAIEYQSVFN